MVVISYRIDQNAYCIARKIDFDDGASHGDATS